jgi:hypothetical protein
MPFQELVALLEANNERKAQGRIISPAKSAAKSAAKIGGRVNRQVNCHWLSRIGLRIRCRRRGPEAPALKGRR